MTFPTDDVELTTILVVSDVEAGTRLLARRGGRRGLPRVRRHLVRAAPGRDWILLVTGGGPTEDKPDVTFAVAEAARVDHAFTMRVADCRSAYDAACSGRGVPDAAGQLAVGNARLLP